MRRSVWDDASFSSFCYYYLNLKNIYKISARVECRINIPLLQDIKPVNFHSLPQEFVQFSAYDKKLLSWQTLINYKLVQISHYYIQI